MSTQQAKYELLKEDDNFRNNYSCLRLCVLIALCTSSTIAVFLTWTVIYKQSLNIPPKFVDIPKSWIYRAETYSNNFHNLNLHNLISIETKSNGHNQSNSETIKQIENERIYPSKFGNYIYKSEINNTKLVCYYVAPNPSSKLNELYPKDIDPFLCTHINVGIVRIIDNRLNIDDHLKTIFEQTKQLKMKNRNLKILLWVGGEEDGFPQMILNHANRKLFIQSLKSVLETYRLDGIDLDWEFPSAYNREKQHFSQLLHEIRREYQREHRTYLLSIAAAAPEGIVFFAYDIREINNYVDYVNIMTYDFNFYTKGSPFTGLNSPLYARHKEHSILATLNINYTINYWHSHGLDKNKIVLGLPTYGHTYRLVNPFNHEIGSPANGFGNVGTSGFASYSEICWFQQNNIYVTKVFDTDTCSPYLYSGMEWISYEDEKSLECKTRYIKENGYGGAMIFSLNTDDFFSQCQNKQLQNTNGTFPLIRKIFSILFKSQ